MLNLNHFSKGCASLVLAGMLVGCAQYENTRPPASSGTYVEESAAARGEWETGPDEAPAAPAPVAQAAPAEPAPAPEKKPAPAPAPAAGAGYSYLALPTGSKSTSALLIERTAPTQVSVNSPFTYEIKATNLTDMPLNEVVVTSTPDANFKVAKSEPAATSSAGGKQVWNLGTLGPRESRTILVTGAAVKAQALKDCLEGSYNSRLCNEIGVVQPALTLTAQAPAQVLSCDPIPVTYVVTNTGTGTAQNVKLDIPLTGLTNDKGDKTVSVLVGNLGAGESRTINSPLKATAAGTAATKGTVVGDGSLKADASTSTKVVKPNLTIAKTGNDSVLLGRDLSYKVVVTNKGDGDARDVVVEDTLPAGTTLKSASDNGVASAGKVSWSLGTLAPGASKELTLTVSAPKIAKYDNNAVARAYCSDAVSAVASTEVKGIPAILLEVVDETDPVGIGETTVYAIGATNQGSAVGTNVSIVCDLENTMEFVSAEGVTAATVAGSRITFAPVKALPAGEKATWRVKVKAKNPGDVRFKVIMTSDQITRSVEETESTNFYK